MFKWLSKLCKTHPSMEPGYEESTDECRHDWEYLEESCIFYKVITTDWYTDAEWKHKEQAYQNEIGPYAQKHWAIKKVCLKCGECVDQEQEADNYFQEKWRREELAAKMWEDCKGTK